MHQDVSTPDFIGAKDDGGGGHHQQTNTQLLQKQTNTQLLQARCPLVAQPMASEHWAKKEHITQTCSLQDHLGQSSDQKFVWTQNINA